MNQQDTYKARLFYSYSHKDHEHQQRMENALAVLRDQDRLLDDWSDQRILPGESISQRIRDRMGRTDIFVFLLSPDFVASPACRAEWNFALELEQRDKPIMLVPVILRRCAWQDLNNMSDFKALPVDAQPILTAADADEAWHQVYLGLRTVVKRLRSTFQIRSEFRAKLLATEFISQDHVSLQDIFVFPNLTFYRETDPDEAKEHKIHDEAHLLKAPRTFVTGEELSGKTALLHHVFLRLADANQPVLYVDLAAANRPASTAVFRDAYRNQYHGDHELWTNQSDKTVLLDNLTSAKHCLDHLAFAADHFATVVATLSPQTYYAYFHDEPRIADFRVVNISPFSHSKQELLIRKRLAVTSDAEQRLTDGKVDQIENRVNAILLSNRILPRFPFYILSILQTYEGFIPTNLPITSYGHCYYVLIVSHLVKSGISKTDDEIGACFNFAEHLAFEIFSRQSVAGSGGPEAEFSAFVNTYRQNYLLKESTLNRMCSVSYGLVRDGEFRNPYIYCFFLGKHLASNARRHANVIERIADRSYLNSNFLALMFTIHHTTDNKILDEIVLRTMCALDTLEPSSLDEKESRFFDKLVNAIPTEILSGETVYAQRKKVRERRDQNDLLDEADPDEADPAVAGEEAVDVINDIYRIMKNGDVLGHILKNKYGSLRRDTIEEVVETVADGGLRLVKMILGYQEELNDLAVLVHERHPKLDLDRVREAIRRIAFCWTMTHVERVVRVLNGREIRPVVEEVVARRDTPAYELVGYFLRLDTIDQFGERECRLLKRLWRKHRYPFFRRVLSLRTQFYLNTHEVAAPVEQAACSALGIRYQPRLKRPRS